MISSGELEIVTTSLQSFLLHGTLGIAALGVSLTVYRGISSFLFGRWSLTRSRVAIREMKENEEWVLITGASSGLGREFASRFANLGLPIILVARRKDLLEEAASNIERRFGVDTLVIEADLSTSQVGHHHHYSLPSPSLSFAKTPRTNTPTKRAPLTSSRPQRDARSACSSTTRALVLRETLLIRISTS